MVHVITGKKIYKGKNKSYVTKKEWNGSRLWTGIYIYIYVYIYIIKGGVI